MVEVTINSIRNGVILALSNLFPDTNVYDEEIKQGFKAPCFFVKLLTAAQEQELNRRFRRSHSFDIQFFPKGPDYNEEAHGMAEYLYEALISVNIDGALYSGTGMNHEIVDGVLHFFVDFNFLAWMSKPSGTKMKTLDQEGHVHG